RGAVGSILTGNITNWHHGMCMAQNRRALQNSEHHWYPLIEHQGYRCGANNIHLHSQFTLLLSDQQYRSIHRCTTSTPQLIPNIPP
ncbi:hypothetical protein GBF38_022165, partial [Nibea albiflora]